MYLLFFSFLLRLFCALFVAVESNEIVNSTSQIYSPAYLPIRFYIFITKQEERYFRDVADMCLEKYNVTVVVFDPHNDRVSTILNSGRTARERLAYPHNFVRFYFADYLPNVRKAIYLDADMLVTNGDLVQLFDETLLGDELASPNKTTKVPIAAVATRYFV
jgi:lipopolysaccharide biosynthesis glycosyltransferase